MTTEILATHTFGWQDQQSFAALSGDCNPMHMDPLAARRTQAGAPVVHGVHGVLRLLDALAQRFPAMPQIASLRVQFDKLIYVGETATMILLRHDEGAIRAEIRVDGALTTRFAIQFGPLADAPMAGNTAIANPREPAILTLEAMAGQRGKIAFATPAAMIATAFPGAARAIGAQRVGALANLSFLVGMVCPGLHSVFGGLSVRLVGETAEAIDWSVASLDLRFRLLRMDVAGGGVAGTVESGARMPPAEQVSMMDIAGLVGPAEFAGTRALVVGGSRGLGEIAAKAIAAGGGLAIITYATGRDDADRVAAEIRSAGGQCDILKLDVRSPAEAQLACLTVRPNQLYFMATPAIFRRRAGVFAPDRLQEFLDFYVLGFWNLVSTLTQRGGPLAVFYPSSVAVDAPPADMAEYAMAKSAGEILSTIATAQIAGLNITVERLPRLATDQTASFKPVDMPDAPDLIVSIVRKVHAASAS